MSCLSQKTGGGVLMLIDNLKLDLIIAQRGIPVHYPTPQIKNLPNPTSLCYFGLLPGLAQIA